MRNKFIFNFLAANTLLVACAFAEHKQPSTFEECLRAPHTLNSDNPPSCVTAAGKVFANTLEIAGTAICKDLCGNGECEEIVCMGSNCPCAESSATCPADCK